MTNEDINDYLRLAIMEEVNKRLGKNFECVNDLIDYTKNLKKENEQLKSELETYQILAHKRGECYLSSLREIKKLKEENEQLQKNNKHIEKRKCCNSCKSQKLDDFSNCQSCDEDYSRWELAENV